MKLALSPTI